jgi:hypothetical protein
MRATLTVLFLAGTILGCSASENANHSIRCDSTTVCPDQMICYREFCIPDQGLPQIELDAAGISVEPAQDDARVRQVPERPASPDAAIAVVDASADTDAFSPIGNGEDAQSGPVVEVPPTEVPPTPVTPPDPGPPTPVVDAGAVVTDAGHNNAAANRALLIVCLPSCGSRSPTCYTCLSGVLSRNPEVCSDAEGVDPLVSGLCDFLCTTAACRGRR